eukprot:1539413-Prymnesium_polylepis.3
MSQTDRWPGSEALARCGARAVRDACMRSVRFGNWWDCSTQPSPGRRQVVGLLNSGESFNAQQEPAVVEMPEEAGVAKA